MTGRAVPLLLCIALSGCGGGSSEPREGTFTVTGGETRTTTNDKFQLTGSAFLPMGAGCTYYPGPFAPPSCTCEPGQAASGQWTNSTTGAGGQLQLTIFADATCVARNAGWFTPAIALAPGSNSISVSMTDGVSRGAATVTVVRN
ncbi:MAG TPA: hypothetical protein VFF05_04930 [Rudaea sp.]|nr:hypothetical protein [Rudaea sp.]